MDVTNDAKAARNNVVEQVPYLISWNTTKRCDLRCSHCYLGTNGTMLDDACICALKAVGVKGVGGEPGFVGAFAP
ncbi:MAG: hypothetical protein HZB22_02075 [Deltaproteobacteria bacterium]|nr:hypothetical protein [Deltaproteobacteria bacterium]